MHTSFEFKPRKHSELKNILAVDPGKNTGIALLSLDGHLPRVKVILRDIVSVDSTLLKPYTESLTGLVERHGLSNENTIVVIETWTFSRNLKTVLGLGRAQQRIADACEIAGLSPDVIYLVNANKWQASILGHNKHTKEHALNFVRLMHPDVVKDDKITEDIADAICIGHYEVGVIVDSFRRKQSKRRSR